MLDELTGRRITVMGLGRFGGGSGLTRWLAGRGALVRLTDTAAAESLTDSLGQIEDLIDRGVVRLRLGGHDESDFTGADLVVANPAVAHPWENPYLRAAADAGVPITTEIRLLFERIDRKRVIGVTGSAGKSTTAAMIRHALVGAGHAAHLGGNIGGTLLASLDAIGPDDWIVLELSSFMLHWLGAGAGRPDAPAFSPHIAVWTNFEPNHLDWHETLEHYGRSKRNIFAAQGPGDHAVHASDVARDDAISSLSVPLLVPGPHNQRNARLALAAVRRATGLAPAAAAPLLADFPGLPHRLRLVLECGGIRCYDDSKSTTPRATVLAVESFPDARRVHLIAGGYDKGSDLAAIGRMASRLGGLYAIGATGAAIIASAGRAAGAFECGTLDAAVTRAAEAMTEGDALLLSPGCASWDQFENFEERGRVFGEAVRNRFGVAPALSRNQDAPDRLPPDRSGARPRAGV